MSENLKRALHPEPAGEALRALTAQYEGSPKHKASPHAFGLTTYTGPRSDRSLCDRDADFKPADVDKIPMLLRRGLDAGLIGKQCDNVGPRLFWTVADSGWIFELRRTNPAQPVFHGYPLLPNDEAIATKVYERFAAWVRDREDAPLRLAVRNCRSRYRIRT